MIRVVLDQIVTIHIVQLQAVWRCNVFFIFYNYG